MSERYFVEGGGEVELGEMLHAGGEGRVHAVVGVFALVVTVSGLCAGGYEDLEKLLPEEDLKRHVRKRTI